MSARHAWPTLALATLSLSACAALFGTSLTPQEQACMRRSMENVPDLTGTWETNTGERLALQPDPGRKTTVRAQFTADSKKPKPNWSIEALYLQWPRNPTPQSEECGPNWTVTVRQTFPDRTAQPGQFVSLTDNRTATLSTNFNSISFGGKEVWTRVGAAVGELQVPKAGDLAKGMAMDGPTLARASGSREIDCVEQCRSNRRCAAMVFRGDVCTTLSQLGRVTAAGGASTWINPSFDHRLRCRCRASRSTTSASRVTHSRRSGSVSARGPGPAPGPVATTGPAAPTPSSAGVASVSSCAKRPLPNTPRAGCRVRWPRPRHRSRSTARFRRTPDSPGPPAGL